MRKLIIQLLLLMVLFAYVQSAAASAEQSQTEQRTGHSQSSLTPQTSSIIQQQIGISPLQNEFAPAEVAVSLYLNPQLSVKRDSGILNIKQADDICVGDTLQLSADTLTGEFFSKGGPTDSPPIVFVDDLESVKRQIEAGAYRTQTSLINICSWQPVKQKFDGPQRCVVEGNVVCQANCNLQASTGLTQSASGFQVSSAGQSKITSSCSPDCIFFVDRKAGPLGGVGTNMIPLSAAYGYMSFKAASQAFPSIPKVSAIYSIDAKESPQPPSLQITSYTKPEGASSVDGQPLVKVLVQNTGQKVFIDDIKPQLGKVVYAPNEIGAGQTGEILLLAQSSELSSIPTSKIDFDYRAEKLGCMQQRDFSTSLYISSAPPEQPETGVQSTGVCQRNSDCESSLCCAGLCRDSGAGSCEDLNGDGSLDTWVPN